MATIGSETPSIMSQLWGGLSAYSSELLAIEATGYLNERREAAGLPPGQVSAADQTPPLTNNNGQNLTGMDKPVMSVGAQPWMVYAAAALLVLVLAFVLGWV